MCLTRDVTIGSEMSECCNRYFIQTFLILSNTLYSFAKQGQVNLILARRNHINLTYDASTYR